MYNTQEALNMLKEIDQIVVNDSKKLRNHSDYDHFMSLVHQKEGIIDMITQNTGKIPRWTIEGYVLDEKYQ